MTTLDRPAPFAEYTTPEFWNDPHISSQMLANHLGASHDLAVLIYEDYCALSPDQRSILLGRIRGASRPGGRLVFDVSAAPRFATIAEDVVTGQNLDNGFWAPSPCEGTHETWSYLDRRLVLDRYTITAAGRTRQFWNWMHCLTPEEVIDELTAAGFTDTQVHGDLTGADFDPAAVSFAVVTTRP